MKDLKTIEIHSTKDLRDWLDKNCKLDESFWLISYKKSTPESYVSWGEIVDQLLCYGWIDSLVRKLDEQRTMRLISKRRKLSIWSLVNKNKVAELLKRDLMKPSGLEAIERAKKDGSWEFLDEVDQLTVPDDLSKELKCYPKAQKYFEEFPRGVKHRLLYWIKSAKRSETRENRIIEVAFLASENIRAHEPER